MQLMKQAQIPNVAKGFLSVLHPALLPGFSEPGCHYSATAQNKPQL